MIKDLDLLDEPSNEWPLPDARPRTPWLRINRDGAPVHPGVYEVAHYPFFKNPVGYAKENGDKQVLLMRWHPHRSSFFSSVEEGYPCVLMGYSGSTYYRGLACKEDSDFTPAP